MHEMQASTAAGEFVKGLDYPIGKPDVLRAASDAELPATIVDQLKEIPDREYRDADELTAALNASA
jgi:hypothetical protein